MTSFVSSPISVTVNTSGNVLTLTGTGTAWAGTPFTLPSGVSGCSITSQTVLTTTSATITLAAGTQVGMLAIFDGTNTFYLSIAPPFSVSINKDNFKRANSALGGVAGGTTDVLNAWEIASNQARTTTVTGNLFTGRLIWPTQFADGTYRVHFGPNYTGTNSAIMLFARAQGTTSTDQCVGFFAFPGNLLTNSSLFSIAAGSTNAHATLKAFTSGTCPSEGWLELITSGSTVTGNIYQADGVTLVGSITYTGLTGTYLSAGYAGLISYNFNNFVSEYDAWESINITTNPPFMPLSTSTVFAVTGQATAFSGSPFTVSGLAGCSITAQTVIDATHATVTILSGSTAGYLLLTDTISGSTFSIFVTATPQIALTPTTHVGQDIANVAITGINVAFAGTPFTVTGTPSASISSTTIIDPHNAIVGLSAGSYDGILTIADSVTGASATFQVYPAVAGTYVIGYIGDSITAGTNGDPVTVMGANLRALGYRVTQVNRGVGGTTSAHWATNFTSILTNAIADFVAAGVTHVQIMLGTNDAKTAINTTPAAYLANLTIITNACLAIGAKVIINQPIWTVPSAFAGTWLAGASVNYQQYYNSLSSLFDNQKVYAGDELGFDWFENNPSHLLDGVHPTPGGNTELGNIWAYSFLRSINSLPILTSSTTQYQIKFGSYVFPAGFYPALDSVDSVVPAVKLPRLDGGRVLPGTLDLKKLTVRGGFMRTMGSGNSIRSSIDALKAALNIGMQSLTFDNDRYWRNVQKTKFSLSYDPTGYGRITSAEIEFTSGDAYSYEVAAQSTTQALIASPTTGMLVSVGGNAPSKPSLVITVTSTGTLAATVTNNTTGEIFTLNGAVTSGQVITVDCLNEAVTISGLDATAMFDGIFGSLNVGANSWSIVYSGVTLSQIVWNWSNRWY